MRPMYRWTVMMCFNVIITLLLQIHYRVHNYGIYTGKQERARSKAESMLAYTEEAAKGYMQLVELRKAIGEAGGYSDES